MAKLTTDSVRDFLRDQCVVDGLAEPLVYSEEEILIAMKRGCAAFNDVPPIFIKFQVADMSDDTNIFLDAVVTQLYKMEHARLTRQDIEYTAGETVVAVDRTRIGHLETLIKYHEAAFRQAANDYKRYVNFQQGFRRY